jgi:FMN phosphatase YigB (HAD superfamily)
LHRRAAQDLGIDLSRSAYIGDRLRDVLPARTLGGIGILVPGAHTPGDERERAAREFATASSLDEAVERFLRR